MDKSKHYIYKCFRDEYVKNGKKFLNKKVCNVCSSSTFPNAARQQASASCLFDVKITQIN